MPGGQGGGGGWARLTAGEASSISGRNANTTADTALRCSHGFIGHLSRGPLRGDSKIRALCGGSNGADGGDHGYDGAGLLHRISGSTQRFAATCSTGGVHRGAAVARRLGWRGSDLTSSSGTRDFCVVSWEGFGPTLQWRISVRTLVSGLIVSPHKAQGATTSIAGVAVR